MEKLIHKSDGSLTLEDPYHIGKEVWYTHRFNGTIVEKPPIERARHGACWVKFDDVSYWGQSPHLISKRDLAFEQPRKR